MLERAGVLLPELGGGSLSMLCLARVDGIALGLAPSVDSVVELDDSMAERAIFPAVNCGSIAHKPSPKFLTGAARQLATLCKKFLSESREVSLHAGLTAEFGLPIEDEARATLDYRNKLTAFLRQSEPLFFEEQAFLIYAGLLRDWEEVAVESIPRRADAILMFVRAHHPHVLEALRALAPTDNMPSALRAAMDDALADCEAHLDENGAFIPMTRAVEGTTASEADIAHLQPVLEHMDRLEAEGDRRADAKGEPGVSSAVKAMLATNTDVLPSDQAPQK